jgi:hypothetical protein
VVGGVAFILIIVGLAFWFWRRRKMQKGQQGARAEEGLPGEMNGNRKLYHTELPSDLSRYPVNSSSEASTRGTGLNTIAHVDRHHNINNVPAASWPDGRSTEAIYR